MLDTVTQSANWTNSRKKAGFRHIPVRLGWSMFSYIKNQWLSISLKKKLGAFSVVVILVMGLSIAFNMLVMNFSLESFNVILNDNSLCYDVQESMEQEADAFELYVRERSWENAKQYRLACFKTESSLDALPFDYDVIGPERYARTWNIKNSYEAYSVFREQILKMNEEESGYITSLYRVYDMQDYLKDYARRLVQVTLSKGNETYQRQVPVFYNIPYLILAVSLCLTVMAIVLTRLLSNTLIQPVVKLAHNSRKIARNDFSGEDFDGNKVDDSLFSGNSVTVVNFWFTGCKPCVAELSTLNELNDAIKSMGGEVVGINIETFDGNKTAIKEAASVLESQGVKYRNLSIDSSSAAGKYALEIMAFPTTILVDRNGNIVGEPMLGGIDNKDNYDALMKQIQSVIDADSTNK